MKLRKPGVLLRHPLCSILAIAACTGFAGIVAAQPKVVKPVTAERQAELLKTFHEEFVSITPGEKNFPATFEMGSRAAANRANAADRPLRTVRMSGPFFMAKYEVPQELYLAVMGSNPSVWGGPRNSVEMVSHRDAVLFCQRATQLMRKAKLIKDNEEIRLPSEAEWEYCCRAGTSTAYSFGEAATAEGDTGLKASTLNAFGWHTGNAAGNDPPVGALKPNAWGLYDFHGYLWEYVADEWHADYSGAPEDSRAWEDADAGPSPQRVIRGGSWRDRYDALQSSTRRAVPDHVRSDAIGFRCVKSAVAESR